MFDNTKPNVILVSDFTEPVFMTKSIGVYKVARELRLAGYQVAVIHHAHVFTYNELKHILANLITDKTLFIGFNNMFYKSFTEVSENEIHKGGVVWAERELGSMLPHGRKLNQDLKTFIKSLNPNCRLVLGGPTATDTADNKDFDYVVIGYADLSSVNLANHLSKQDKLLKSYRSLHGFKVVNDPTAEGFDFTNRKMEYELYDCILPGETLPIELSRGCIFQCAFCGYPLNGKKKLDYIKNPEILYREFIDNYEKFGVTRYHFLDDTFNDSAEKIKLVYDISQRLPFKLEYWAYIRLDLLAAHPENIDLLFESGLRSCYFGIETLNKETGEAIGKGMAKEKLIKTLRYIKTKWGNEVMLHGGLIAGLPYESKESLRESCEFFLSNDSPLDSWIIRPLYLEVKDNRTSGFFSKISNNPENYGYKNIKALDSSFLYWENEHMTFTEANEISNYYNNLVEKSNKKKLAGFATFLVAGLGYDLEYTTNKTIMEIDWHSIDLRKQERAKAYRNAIYQAFNIPAYISK